MLVRFGGLVIVVAFRLAIALNANAVAAEQATKPAGASLTRPVKFLTYDQIEIHASYIPPAKKESDKAPIVVLLHAYGADRTSFDPLVPFLRDAGCATLAIDMRGHGRSAGPPEMNLPKRVADRDPKLFREMHRDVQAAYLWLSAQPEADAGRFALIGASVGCSVALTYAGRDRSVDVVVGLTPGTKYLGIDSARDARKYGRRPLLLLAAEPERNAADILGAMVPGCTLQIVAGRRDDEMALHGTRMLGRIPRIEQLITEFLVKAVGPPATQPVAASLSGEVYHSPDSPSVRRIKKDNLRYYSSPAEAESRGLRAPKLTSREAGG